MLEPLQMHALTALMTALFQNGEKAANIARTR